MRVLFNAVSQARHLQRTAGEHFLVGTPQASATKALLRLGNALVGGDADGTYIGVNAPSGYVGALYDFQINGVSQSILTSDGNLGLGGIPSANRKIFAVKNVNTTTSIRLENQSDGTLSAASWSLAAGTALVATGTCLLTAPTHAAGCRLSFSVGSAANGNTGITFSANDTGQDLRFEVGGIGEQMRLSSGGHLLVGTTSNIARLGVVGRADEIQGIIRAFSTQTGRVFQVQNSATSELFGVANNGNCSVAGSLNATSLAGTATAAVANRFGGTASAGTLLSVVSGVAGNVALALRGVASQTGALLELRQLSSTSTDRVVAVIDGAFAVSTDASRQGRLTLSAVDFNGTREFLRGEADGTVAKIGFLGATAVVRQSVTGSRGGNAALASFLTAVATLGLITDNTTA